MIRADVIVVAVAVIITYLVGRRAGTRTVRDAFTRGFEDGFQREVDRLAWRPMGTKKVVGYR